MAFAAPAQRAWAREPAAVLLDLDGTLVDTLDDFVVALQAMLDDMPAPFCHHCLQRSEVEPVVGKGSDNLVRQVLALVQIAQNAKKNVAHGCESDALEAQALERYLHHYRGINGRHARLYAGVEEALRALQARGVPLACVTNKPTLYAQELLLRMGLEQFFPVVIGGDAVAHKKPDPMPVLEACSRLGVAPACSLMVGDSSNDAQAARAAGCPVLLVRYGYNHGAPVDAVDADGYCDSLAEVFCQNA